MSSTRELQNSLITSHDALNAGCEKSIATLKRISGTRIDARRVQAYESLAHKGCAMVVLISGKVVADTLPGRASHGLGHQQVVDGIPGAVRPCEGLFGLIGGLPEVC
jgi:hypothetical protein